MSLIKVNKNENPYDVIGNYIEKHVSAIDNIIAVISINGEIHNELFLIDGEIDSVNNFVWQIDWWEGEENIELIDFFFVSDACKKYNDNDLVNRRAAIDAAIEAADDWDGGCNIGRQKRIENYINKLPSAQSKIEPLTDKEQRIFLWAMKREKEICEKIDEDLGGEECCLLSRICYEIERKVKRILWT